MRDLAVLWHPCTQMREHPDVLPLVPVERGDIRGGDVLLFRWRAGYVAKHAAIATGEGTMIHAHDGAAVCEVALSPWWQRRLAFVFRFPGVN